MHNDKLVKKIAKKNIFCRGDKKHLREWFSEKLVAYFSALLSDSALETKVTNEIIKAVQIIRSRYQPYNPLLSSFGNSKRIVKNRWRREVVYGIVGVHPELLNHEAQLDLIISRRLRVLEKMKYAVNRDMRIFRYPASTEDQAVNPNAAPCWTKMHDDVFYLSKSSDIPGATESGIDNPANALSTIFSPPSKARVHMNKLYCQQVATVVLMDSFLAINDADLLPTLARVNEGYLRIGNPYGDIRTSHMEYFSVDENEGRALLQNADIDFNDLQLGDHVHIRNHEAYNILSPMGSWQGEHAFVTHKADKKKYKFHGHGFSSGYFLAQIRMFMIRKLRIHFKQAQKKIITFYVGDKEEDGTEKDNYSNGANNILSYGMPGNNIIRDTERENELPDKLKYACWYIGYPRYVVVNGQGYWGHGKMYFFNINGDANRITLKDMPEMPFTTKSNEPFSGKCQVIRPKVG